MEYSMRPASSPVLTLWISAFACSQPFSALMAYPELTDVYYIQSQVNQETKEVKRVLVRRGNEFHGPDRMFLNERHIELIEPVGEKSDVAKLIEADKKK
jgi:hypothetical protein